MMKRIIILSEVKPVNYITEETMRHLRLGCIKKSRYLLRAVEAGLACKLTLTYGKYHQMRDLHQLATSDEPNSNEHAEVMAAFINQLPIGRHTTPSELYHTQEEYTDEAIDAYKEYKRYCELFEDKYFKPAIVEQFCKTVYDADDYYTFKVYSNLYYSVYAEALLLYQMGSIDYLAFTQQFQTISLFDGRRKPLSSFDLKLFLRTMHKVVDLYIQLLLNSESQILT